MSDNLPLFSDFRLATLLAAEERGLARRLLRRMHKTSHVVRQVRAALAPELAEWLVQLVLADSRRAFAGLAPGELSERLYHQLRMMLRRDFESAREISAVEELSADRVEHDAAVASLHVDVRSNRDAEVRARGAARDFDEAPPCP